MNQDEKDYLLAADTNYVVEEVAFANGALTIANQPDKPRNITMTVTDADTSIDQGIITIVGSYLGNPVTEVLDITDGLVQAGTSIFDTITSITISGAHGNGALDTIIMGIGTIVQVTTGRTELKEIVISNSAATVTSAGILVIDGTTGSAANVATINYGTTEQSYLFDCVLDQGLRIVQNFDNPILVTWTQSIY